MSKPKTRVGYFTFSGLDGPTRHFEADEPLALALLVSLERATATGAARPLTLRELAEAEGFTADPAAARQTLERILDAVHGTDA